MKLGDLLCKLGMHRFKNITYVVNRKGWGSLFNGEYVSHYECDRCKQIKHPSVAEWDGTDNA